MARNEVEEQHLGGGGRRAARTLPSCTFAISYSDIDKRSHICFFGDSYKHIHPRHHLDPNLPSEHLFGFEGGRRSCEKSRKDIIMKLAFSFLVLAPALVQAWLPTSQTHRSLTSLELSTDVSPDVFTKPEKITMDDLPTVYVYDHCPFCVRVRLALGIKNVKHKINFMANDDVQTPTSLVGKKIAPIFVSHFCSSSAFELCGKIPLLV